MIQLSDLSKKFPDRTIFRNAGFRLNKGMRVGLVGPNGSGKTTLFRMIMGEEEPDKGSVERPRQITFGYLPQEITSTSNASILEEVLDAIPMLKELESKIQACSLALTQNPDDSLLAQRLGDLQQDYEHRGGYEIEFEAKRILGGLGFVEAQFQQSLETFSGGWRMRVALARILVSNPDILLLDEPTNHLDLVSLIWLEGFLKDWKGTLVLISHDRQFLNASVDHILEIDQQQLFLYSGNFSAYRQEKILRREQQEAAYKQQQREIETTERFIERFRYKNTKAKQVQSRVKKLGKIERIEAPSDYRKQIHLRIPQPSRSPRILTKIRSLAKAYGDNQVFGSLTMDLERGQKIGLVGPNGAGKSTLLKLLAGVEGLTGGELLHTESVDVAYFAQHQLETLDPDLDILETITRSVPRWTQGEMRSYLGGFLFTGASVEKKVGVLSGGETSRLALARMLSQPAHLLLLDEPTNHLDMDARDRVEEVLSKYEGTLVCISHDRHFLNAVTNRTAEVGQGTVRFFEGNYDYYAWKIEEEANRTLNISPAKDEGNAIDDRGSYQLRKKIRNRLKKLPTLIAEAESNIAAQEDVLNDPEKATDAAAIEMALEKQALFEETLFELLEEEERLRQEYDENE